MLQRSLQVLVVAALVALAMTLAYAALSLQGPDETIAAAQAKAARGEFARAIAEIGLAERDVRDDRERTAIQCAAARRLCQQRDHARADQGDAGQPQRAHRLAQPGNRKGRRGQRRQAAHQRIGNGQVDP